MIGVSIYLANMIFKGEASILYPKELRQYEAEFAEQISLEDIEYDGSGVSLCMLIPE